MQNRDEQNLNIIVKMVPHPYPKVAIDLISKLVLEQILEEEVRKEVTT